MNARSLLMLPLAIVGFLGCDQTPSPSANPASSASAAAKPLTTTMPPSKPSASTSTMPSASGSTSATTSASASGSTSATPPPYTQNLPSDTPETDTITTNKGPLEVHPIHHGTLFFTWDKKTFVVDPWTDGGAGDLSALTAPVDAIFITDIHPDHLDPDTVAKLKGPKTQIVAPQAVADKLKDVNVILKNGDSKDILGMKVEAIPMYNLKNGPEPGKFFHDKGRGDGFVFTFGDKRVYVSGDTECTDEMKALKNVDVAFVCMNLPYTMPPSEAAQCVNAFKPKIVYPYHFRGSNLDDFTSAIPKDSGVEVRIRKWY